MSETKTNDGVNQTAATKQLKKLTETTKSQLAERPKVKVFIPPDALNPKDTHAVVGINGHIFRIQRGQSVEVPDLVADVWNESYAKTITAETRIQVQRNDAMLA